MQDQLKLDPHSGVTVVFRSKRGDRLKILVWDGSGLVLIYKRLDQGSFAWVKTGPEGIDPSSGRIDGTNARSAGVQDGVMRLSRAQRTGPCQRRSPMSPEARVSRLAWRPLR
ncbi:IS66 family insertion sequence element accessory protein TnpB [Rhodobacter sp. CZR27]|uniref:IS66 family insertion sequence element accessory protein TnpB n=1 Tax=Rhodobacter sp. CZR27 TaxID=2033869 RepID=UPI0012FD35F4